MCYLQGYEALRASMAGRRIPFAGYPDLPRGGFERRRRSVSTPYADAHLLRDRTEGQSRYRRDRRVCREAQKRQGRRGEHLAQFRAAALRFTCRQLSPGRAGARQNEQGATVSKSYDPWLVFNAPDYAKPGNSQKVDAIFAGKRLNSRVHVIALDKTAGRFAVHFLPLKVDEKDPAPQGFNGGHLHHPISDPPPRGLGLPSSYSSSDSPTTAPARG